MARDRDCMAKVCRLLRIWAESGTGDIPEELNEGCHWLRNRAQSQADKQALAQLIIHRYNQAYRREWVNIHINDYN